MGLEPQDRMTRRGQVEVHLGDALDLYRTWPRPTVIISDGPYGLRSYPGDPAAVDALPDWYRPHVRAWSDLALPSTTLWFWNSELGWATVHPLLVRLGWEYRNCHVWNKGRAHVAGNANSRTLRKFPVVTEVCVQYVRQVRLPSPACPEPLLLKDWLRREWERAGLPLSLANQACGVVNAATRKYFTRDHLWYFPPPDAFDRLVAYANDRGRPAGRPYFTADGTRSLTGREWRGMRAKFHCLFGVSNVWTAPPVNGAERIRRGTAAVHANQKPLELTDRMIRATSDPGDVVWEPFGGMCTAAVAALGAGRRCHSAEVLPRFYELAARRLAALDGPGSGTPRAGLEPTLARAGCHAG
jgi:site-specific DNA-methyltransferase (adenine-specific)